MNLLEKTNNMLELEIRKELAKLDNELTDFSKELIHRYYGADVDNGQITYLPFDEKHKIPNNLFLTIREVEKKLFQSYIDEYMRNK
jgi:hypothetical protein